MTEAAGAGNWTSRHHRFTPRNRYLAVALACLALTALAEPVGAYKAFTEGNLVVYRAGDGALSLSTDNAVAVFLCEYTTAIGQGPPVQSLSVSGITASGGTATGANGLTEGFLTRSPNGLYLALTGYNAAVGPPVVATTTSNSTTPPPTQIVARVVGIVDSGGRLNATTALLNTYDKGSIRSAVTLDGTKIYTAGRSTSTTLLGTDGVRSTTTGSVASAPLNDSRSDDRQVNIFNGQLYFSYAGSTGRRGIYSLGSASAPSSTPGLVADTDPSIPTPASSPCAFFFASTTTLYVADDQRTGGILKYTSTNGGSTFALAYHLIPTQADNPAANIGVRGLTGTVSGSSTVLFATTADAISDKAGNRLVSVTDTGAGSTFVTLATAGANTAFRGVALAPTATPAAVRLISFTATRYTSSIWLNWRTGLEVDNLGFNVYREVPREGGGRRVRLNASVIAGSALRSGSGGGYSYAWPDMAGDTGGARYWLEDVDTHGTSTWHGPVTAGVGRGTGAAQRRSPLLGETALTR